MVTNWERPPLPARFADSGHPAFVGRRQELERLEEVWESVERGKRQAVFIGGEPGSGKSRLSAEVARALDAQDVAVLLGTTSPDLGYPYQSMVEALNHLLLGTDKGDLQHLMPEGAGELLRITPHVRRHTPDLIEPAPSEPEYRRELFEAYSELIGAVAGERPVALILEDLHWASSPTRLLLSHLVESTSEVPLLILATTRNTAPDRSDELSFAIADLYRLPGVSRIDLTGLEPLEIENYLRLEGVTDQGHIKETAAVLKDQTGGNPFFIHELWRDMSQSGGFVALRSGTFAPPLTVRDSLEKRIRSFGEVERTMLELAAVAGDTFDVRDVSLASDQPRETTLAALDTATEFGLIRNDGGATSFAFHHALVRQAVLAGLSATRAAQLHARLAEVVEPQFESKPGLAPLLARLYGGAKALGYDEKTVYYLSQAALQAERGLAHEEAGELWEQAARTSSSDRPRQEEMLLCSAHSHLRAGDFPEARRLYKEVHGSSDPGKSLKAAVGFEDASWRPGHHGEEALELLTSVLDRTEADPSDPAYVNAITALGRAHTFSGQLDEAGRIGITAIEMARSLGNDRLVANALVASLLRVMTSPGSSAVNYQRAVELREIALRIGEYDRLGPAGAYRAFASYMAGDIEGWYAGWDDIKVANRKTAQPFWEWVVGCYQYCHEFMQGYFAAAETTAEAIRTIGYGFGTDDTEGPYGIQLYMTKRETGQLEAIRPLISGNPAQDGTWPPGLLALYTELGLDEPASDLLWGLLDTVESEAMRTAIWPAILVYLAEAAIHLRDSEAISVIQPLMAEYEGYNLIAGQSVAVFGSSDRYLAQMSAVKGDFDQSELHFKTALSVDAETRSVVHQGETLARYAAMLRERGRTGDADHAEKYEERARALAEPIGHHRVLAALEGSGSPDALPDGLTPREIDVLRLLAEGASNKEIGESLYISQNTAANHVRSILIKTGNANRTAAAIYAAANGLVH